MAGHYRRFSSSGPHISLCKNRGAYRGDCGWEEAAVIWVVYSSREEGRIMLRCFSTEYSIAWSVLSVAGLTG